MFAHTRKQQMQAARTIRRTAEIEALMNERIACEATNDPCSPWRNPSQEPPPASIGNAVKFNPPPIRVRLPPQAASTTAMRSIRTSPPNPPHNSAVAGSTTRRQQICACCSQPRIRGHVRTCTHVNRVCAKCRKAASK